MSLIVTLDGATLVTENIELPRLTRDEFAGLPLRVLAQPWHESDVGTAAREVMGRAGSGSAPTSPSWRSLRRAVTGEWYSRTVAARSRLYGHRSCRGSSNATSGWGARRPKSCRRSAERFGRARPNRRSWQASTRGCAAQGIAQEVDIVCADGRLWQDRHGLYSDRRIERYAMLVFCAHKWGLVANLTRMVHVGPVPTEIRERHRALAALDRRLMEATRPGVPLREIFTGTLQPGYAALGEPDAWRDHHQGGSTGYTGRDQRVTPTTEGIVQTRQAYAWNPRCPVSRARTHS